MTDPHLLGPDLAPTPFTAAEICAGCPDGRWALVRTERDGGTSHHRTSFDAGDAEGVTVTQVPTDASGAPAGEPRQRRATWRELQGHAAFPAARTRVGDERIRLEIGERDCLRYDVEGDDGASTFWFAVAHPGMPVRYTTPGLTAETIAIG